MEIKWLGHASFLITSQDQKKIIVDPYHTGQGLNYNPIVESADIVTKSHDHGDHNNTSAVKGHPTVLSQAGSQTVKGIEIKAFPAFHDEAGGIKRGSDLIFTFLVDGIKLCHLGDLGHQLTSEQVKELGKIDVLFIPVGGYFTIDAGEATKVISSINPRLVFPMHYKTTKLEYPISGVDQFLKDKKNVRRMDSSVIEVKQNTLPKETEIIVLQPAN